MLPAANMWTAFILYNHSLFAHGLKELLEREEGVNVVGTEARGEKAFAHIRDLEPDVVIVEAGHDESEPQMLLSRLLKEHCQARVVQLNLEDNACVSYSVCRCTTNSVEDLVKCIVSSMVIEQPQRSRQRCHVRKAD